MTAAARRGRAEPVRGAVTIRCCVFCLCPVTACMSRRCIADGWVHLRSRLHACPGGRTSAWPQPAHLVFPPWPGTGDDDG